MTEHTIMDLCVNEEEPLKLRTLEFGGVYWSDNGEPLQSFIFPQGHELVVRQEGDVIKVLRRIP